MPLPVLACAWHIKRRHPLVGKTVCSGKAARPALRSVIKRKTGRSRQRPSSSKGIESCGARSNEDELPGRVATQGLALLRSGHLAT